MCNDTETGFYYLQSRYYDPALGRFINGDSFASTGQGILGFNMFAYCNNNPVMSYDPTGHSNEAYYEWMLGAGGGSAMEAMVSLGATAVIAAAATHDATPAVVPEAKSASVAQENDREKNISEHILFIFSKIMKM